MALKKTPPRPADGEFLFEIDETPLEETLTSFGGLPLFLRTARSLGVGASVERNLRIKQRRRGLDEAAYVESFLALNAVGGECLEDFTVLREDRGMAAMLGYEPPSPEAARKFLYAFHDEETIARTRQQQLALERAGVIAGESEAPAGLAAVNRDIVGELGRRCADQRIAAVDVDATIVESHKRQARPTYQGSTGYQPLSALWAEMDVVLADQFRDGNTPAIQEPLTVARRAFEALPETVNERCFRGDTAAGILRVAAVSGGGRGRVGVGGGRVFSGGEGPPRAAALLGAAGREEAGRVVRRRLAGQALRGGDELAGLAAAAFAGVASREGGLD